MFFSSFVQKKLLNLTSDFLLVRCFDLISFRYVRFDLVVFAFFFFHFQMCVLCAIFQFVICSVAIEQFITVIFSAICCCCCCSFSLSLSSFGCLFFPLPRLSISFGIYFVCSSCLYVSLNVLLYLFRCRACISDPLVSRFDKIGAHAR